MSFCAKKIFAKSFLLHYFKKTAVETHRNNLQRLIYRRFRNNMFDVDGKKCSGTSKEFEDEELQALFHEDSLNAN